jgi:hypothetical protein
LPANGQKAAVARVFQGLFDAACYMDLRRLPELYCGFQRGRGRGPTLYPVACSPQAWAAGTPFLLLQSSLGLEFDLERKRDRAAQSRNCRRLSKHVTLKNLRLGDFSVDIGIRRAGPTVSLECCVKPGWSRWRLSIRSASNHVRSGVGTQSRHMVDHVRRRASARTMWTSAA